jgi:hypothetical protein
LARYINVIYAVIVWAAALIIIKPKRILKLWPISLLAALALFGTELFFTSLKQYKFNNPFLPIVGIPLFHLIWGAGSGLIFIYFMKKEFGKKLAIILVFTIVVEIFGYFSSEVGNHHMLGNFSRVYHFVENFITLSFLAWISEGMFKDRIYPNAFEK